MSKILNYDRYEYFAGYGDQGGPVWTNSEDQATAVPNLESWNQASAIYHEQTASFLFLTAEPPASISISHPMGTMEGDCSGSKGDSPLKLEQSGICDWTNSQRHWGLIGYILQLLRPRIITFLTINLPLEPFDLCMDHPLQAQTSNLEIPV